MGLPPKPGADELESLRSRLLGLAYRMLGSTADAEDAVQDAYLRFQQVGGVEAPDAWLVKTTTRLCIDRLRKEKRRATYIGPWLPEPVPETWAKDVPDRLELAESLSMAFLVLLETLSPAERATYVLREVFHYEFEEIASLLDKSAVNVRQIAARARKRLGQNERRFRPEVGRAEDLAGRFYAACRSGDLSSIESLLSEEAIYFSDGGGNAPAAPRPLLGRRRIANLLSVVFRKRQRSYTLTEQSVNGQPGIVFSHEGKVVQILTFATRGDRIDRVYSVLNPEKLRRWTSGTSAGRIDPINNQT
jgi:RNA polymerase sigma-70 factor (ECF subfamily)